VSALKEGGRASSAGRERHRARNALVVAEIALAVVLLVASGLMIRTFVATRQVHPGFVRPEEVLTVRVSIPESLIKDDEQAIRAFEQIAHSIERIPGVTSVGVSSSISCRRSVASSGRRRTTSRPWATRSSRDARSRGPTSTAAPRS
jgi:hypothetical protein